MAISYANARTIIQQAIADSSNSTFVDQCLNMAQREVARARRWNEMVVRAFFNTVDDYSTGSVAVTNNSTTVTLTGGTWPSDVATGTYRFQLSTADPWYGVLTRSSDTVILLAQAYVGATATGQTYLVHKPHHSLASAVDRVEEMWLMKGGEAVPLVNAATDQTLTEFLHYSSGPGTPTHFYSMERDSSGNRQVLLGPETPDAVYRIEYTYIKKVTDDTFTGNLDESRIPVILARALSLAYAPEHYERSQVEYQKYLALLDREWAMETEAIGTSVRVGDTRVRYPAQHHMETLLGRGRVADPE